MAVDYVIKWATVDGLSSINFSGDYEIEQWGKDEIIWTPRTSESVGDGEFAADGVADARVVTISGLLKSATYSPDDLRAKWDALNYALSGSRLGKLYKNSDRFLYCRNTSVSRDDDESYTHLGWTATFRASNPFYHAETPSTQTLATSGATALAVSGGYTVLPTISLTVSSSGTGGTVTVTHTTVTGLSESFVLTPTAIGTYVIDCNAGTVMQSTTNMIGQFSGTFFENVLPSGSTLTITLAGGATLSAASATWRQRFLGA